ncbi:hypothetical protein FACS1894125_3210 [Actinomycetota bacterium]|nr:hypothetical protein FACS1894125_3210 [Actinomycetota bacterium]
MKSYNAKNEPAAVVIFAVAIITVASSIFYSFGGEYIVQYFNNPHEVRKICSYNQTNNCIEPESQSKTSENPGIENTTSTKKDHAELYPQESPVPSVNGVPFWAADFGLPDSNTSPNASFSSGQLKLDIYQLSDAEQAGTPHFDRLKTASTSSGNKPYKTFKLVATNTSDEPLALDNPLILDKMFSLTNPFGVQSVPSSQSVLFDSPITTAAIKDDYHPPYYILQPNEHFFYAFDVAADSGDILKFGEDHTSELMRAKTSNSDKTQWGYTKVEYGKVPVK